MVHEIYRGPGTFLGVLEGQDTLHLSCIKREEFRVRHGRCRGEMWAQSKDQGTVTLSFRNSRVNLYLKSRKKKGARLTLQNASTQPSWMGLCLDRWSWDACYSNPEFQKLDWAKQQQTTNQLRVNGRLTLECLIRSMAERHGLASFVKHADTDVTSAPHLTGLIEALLYPVLGEFYAHDLKPWNNLPSSVTPALRGRNLNEVAKRAFGRDNKKLVRLLGESLLHVYVDDRDFDPARRINLDNFQLALLAKGYVPVDDLYQILQWHRVEEVDRRTSALDLTARQIAHCRRLLRCFSRERIMRFVEEVHNDVEGSRTLLDTVKMFCDPEVKGQLFGLPAKPKSLTQVHDEVARQWRRMERASDKLEQNLQIPKKLKELDGQGPGDLKLIIPQTARELSAWGHEMHNCIGSYAERVRNRQSIILGFERNGKLVYNLEVHPSSGRVAQFSTHQNQRPKPEDFNAVVNWLADHQLIRQRYPADRQEQAQGVE